MSKTLETVIDGIHVDVVITTYSTRHRQPDVSVILTPKRCTRTAEDDRNDEIILDLRTLQRIERLVATLEDAHRDE